MIMATNSEDYQLEVLVNLSLDKSRIVFSPSPIVLLCGGRVVFKKHPEDDDPPIASLRHAITVSNTDVEYEIFRPEEITDWKEDGVFNNLLDFESELASICSLVVVVLESEGAFAELGVFSQMHELKSKIFVINSQDLCEENSFINLGVLRYIKRETKTDVRIYPWRIDNPSELENYVIEDALHDIGGQLKKNQKSQAFNKEYGSHVITLITELVRLFVALKENEIYEFLDFLDMGITKEALRRKLFILERFKVIKRERYGDYNFFTHNGIDFNKIRFSTEPDFNFDELRVEIRCKELYLEDANKHRHRNRVIKRLGRS